MQRLRPGALWQPSMPPTNVPPFAGGQGRSARAVVDDGAAAGALVILVVLLLGCCGLIAALTTGRL